MYFFCFREHVEFVYISYSVTVTTMGVIKCTVTVTPGTGSVNCVFTTEPGCVSISRFGVG